MNEVTMLKLENYRGFYTECLANAQVAPFSTEEDRERLEQKLFLIELAMVTN